MTSSQQRNYDEAVQCKIHVAALISEFLTKQNNGRELEGIPASNSSFSPVSPNINTETGLPSCALNTGVHFLSLLFESAIFTFHFMIGRGGYVQS